MIRLVADASVAVKWVLPERPEADAEAALDLLAGIRDGALELVEPVHWVAEVAAVVVRLRPAAAKQALALLEALDFDVEGERETYELACDLATRGIRLGLSPGRRPATGRRVRARRWPRPVPPSWTGTRWW